MTTKHTPGPWHYQPGRDSRPPYVIRGAEGGFVVVGMTAERQEADAALIAAAPELLEALEDLKSELVLSDVDQDYIESHFRRCLNKAAAAIAKATGDRLGQLAAESAIAQARGAQ